MNMTSANLSARQDRVVHMTVAGSFEVGQEVYLNEQYYTDFNTSVIEVPKYGWQVKTLSDGVATIEYQRRNLKLQMSLTLDTTYLTKEA